MPSAGFYVVALQAADFYVDQYTLSLRCAPSHLCQYAVYTQAYSSFTTDGTSVAYIHACLVIGRTIFIPP
jgi:hypothetical protein